MEQGKETSNTPEVNVEKKVMQKIMDGKIKIKRPLVLFMQEIWRYVVIFVIFTLIIGAGIFLVKKFF